MADNPFDNQKTLRETIVSDLTEAKERLKQEQNAKLEQDLALHKIGEKQIKEQINKFASELLDSEVEPFLSNEQSFLLDYITYNFDTFQNNTYVNSELVTRLPEDVTNENFLSKCTSPDGFEHLMNIRPIDQARLVPSIELFKVFYDGETPIGEEQFVFKNYTNLTNIDVITKDRLFRGDGAGIKSCTIDLEGKNQSNYTIVNVKLTLLFQDLATAFEEKDSQFGSKISYADLFSVPTKSGNEYFGIKLLVGYNKDESILSDLDTKFNKLSIRLGFVKNSLELNEDSSCKVVIEYYGWIEQLLNDPLVSNIFKVNNQQKQLLENTNIQIQNKQDILTDKKNELSKDFSRLNLSEEMAQKIKSLREGLFLNDDRQVNELLTKNQKLKEEQKQVQFQQEVQKVITKNIRLQNLKEIFSNKIKTYSIFLNYQDIIQYRKLLTGLPEYGNLQAFFKQFQQTIGTAEQQIDIGSSKIDATETFKRIGENKIVSFVLLGDLISEIMLYLQEDIKKLYRDDIEILLGNIVFIPPSQSNPIQFNLANLPISLAYLNNFLVDKFIGRSQMTYTFYQFIKDLIEEFITKTIQSAATLRPLYNGSINTLNLSYQAINKDKSTNEYSATKVINITNNKLVFFIYTISHSITQSDSSYEDNIKNKIPHFFFAGMDRGVTKSIKFSNLSNGKFKTAIYEQSYSDDIEHKDTAKFGGFIQPEIYSVDIDMIGYPYIMNGNVIYVDTSLIGLFSGKAKQLLVGGYYVLNKVYHEIGTGVFTTKISGIFQSKDATNKQPLKIIKESELKSGNTVIDRRVNADIDKKYVEVQ